MKFTCPRCQTTFEKFGKDVDYTPHRYGRHDGLGHPVDCPPQWYGSCPTCGRTVVNQEPLERKKQTMKTKFRRYYFTKVFVEWRDNPDEEMHLSLIPLSAFIDGLLGRWFNPDFHFEFKWVPPWKVRIVENC